MKNDTNIIAVLVQSNLVVLVDDGQCVALNPCYNSSDGAIWTTVCACGCSNLKLKKAERVANSLLCELISIGEGAEDFLAEHGFNSCHCTREEIDLLLK